MRFLVLFAFFTLAAVPTCQSYDDDLIAEAERAGAPFTPASLSRIDSELWSFDRAAIAPNFAVINRSTKSFKLRKGGAGCFNLRGKFSPGLEPEIYLAAGTSTVFGVQEDGTRDDDVRCIVAYDSPDRESFIEIQFDAKAEGDPSIAQSDGSLEITEEIHAAPGVYQAVYTVNNRIQGSGPYIMLSQHGRLAAPQMKPKGNRNKFVKASKSGSRVRTI